VRTGESIDTAAVHAYRSSWFAFLQFRVAILHSWRPFVVARFVFAISANSSFIRLLEFSDGKNKERKKKTEVFFE
jgi:hypothetical protein